MSPVGPHVSALVDAIRRCPKRPTRDGVLGTWLDRKRLSVDLRAYLEVWAWHRPQGIAVGRFSVTDKDIGRSFELPVLEKDGPGPEDGCIDTGRVREDVIVLGRVGQGVLVVEFYGDVVRETPIRIEGWNHLTGDPTFEALLAYEHRQARKSGAPSVISVEVPDAK